MKRYGWIILGCVIAISVAASIELMMGRLPLGPDGKFGKTDIKLIEIRVG